MIYNIVDGRKHPNRWRYVYAIVEPTHHENYRAAKEGGDEIDSALFAHVETDYDERVHISLHDAVIWAERLPFAATLYIYDDGSEKIEFGYDSEGRRTPRQSSEMVMKP